MVQAQRHHVVYASLSTVHHHIFHLREKRAVIRVSLRQPLLGDLLCREIWIPRQPSISIPVSLREIVAAPISVHTHVAHASDTPQQAWLNISEELLPHRSQINQVLALPQVLLGNLELHHLVGCFHLVKDRSIRFPGLEIERAILGLQ